MAILDQLLGGGDLLSQLLSLVILFVFILFAPRLMTTQTIIKLEKDVVDIEAMAVTARNHVLKAIPQGNSARTREAVRNFLEFFAVSPVDIDPYGQIKRLDHILRNADERFKYFVKQIAPKYSIEHQKNIKNALAGAMTTHQIAKIVRHLLETIKKYKMFQLAMILQMQIPLISRAAKSATSATEAFVEGEAIGDGIGPLVVTNMIKGRPKIYADEEFLVYKSRISGKTVFICKAAGPGASTGMPGKFFNNIMKKQKIDRIISVDAGMRLEGERSGAVAEGVGVAMGGSGVDRYEIEELAVKHDIPLDAIAIKVSEEEALMPMTKEVFASVDKAIKVINETVKRGPRRERLLLIGVGNTCGIGNNAKTLTETQNKILKRARLEEQRSKEKKRKWWKWQ